ncbi:hypothetical protein HF563_18100 [Acidithiobacillus ferridurans]|nr:hypothetical protein [Acidithiobacillus ferridurans]
MKTQKELAYATVLKQEPPETPDDVMAQNMDIQDDDPMWWYFAAQSAKHPTREMIETIREVETMMFAGGRHEHAKG